MRYSTREKARHFVGRKKDMAAGTRREKAREAVTSQQTASVAKDMAAGGKSAAAMRKILISDADGYQVHLVALAKTERPTFEPQCAADILCLDLHAFGVEKAIEWVDEAQSRRVDLDLLPLCIMVIGNKNDLSAEELWRVSAELEPAGAIFHRWPENCTSFGEAFEQLGQSLSSFYGRSTLEDLAVKQP